MIEFGRWIARIDPPSRGWIGGPARLNDKPIIERRQSISIAVANPDGGIKLSTGRKRHAPVARLLKVSTDPPGPTDF